MTLSMSSACNGKRVTLTSVTDYGLLFNYRIRLFCTSWLLIRRELAVKQLAECPVIPKPAIFRAAGVSPTAGDPVVDRLRESGKISPEVTPTGRMNLTPPDGEIVFNALVYGQL